MAGVVGPALGAVVGIGLPRCPMCRSVGRFCAEAVSVRPMIAGPAMGSLRSDGGSGAMRRLPVDGWPGGWA